MASATPTPGRCLDYAGYREANFGLAACNGWSLPGIGGQTWTVSNGSLFVVGQNDEKCVDVLNCDLGPGAAAQVCSCAPPGGGTDAGADCGTTTCSGKNTRWQFDFDASGGPSTIATAVDNYKSCLTAPPLPSTFAVVGNLEKELGVYSCGTAPGAPVWTCTKNGADCGSAGPGCETAFDWTAVPADVASNPGAFRLQTRDKTAAPLCVVTTATPKPPPPPPPSPPPTPPVGPSRRPL